ncbi:hypothetical protein KP509_1Z301700 [Ceratopteris richardii]|nr:hypothetical protein KP509_1Z301700 [Ceratopteris richardii]KAH6554854.1 hypothetical protein KP509_1Z301700 [Ceratopteris richardii]
MLFGRYPFIGETLQGTYDEIVHGTLKLPERLDNQLSDLLKGLLCKDPLKRMTLDQVIQHQYYIGC